MIQELSPLSKINKSNNGSFMKITTKTPITYSKLEREATSKAPRLSWISSRQLCKQFHLMSSLKITAKSIIQNIILYDAPSFIPKLKLGKNSTKFWTKLIWRWLIKETTTIQTPSTLTKMISLYIKVRSFLIFNILKVFESKKEQNKITS